MSEPEREGQKKSPAFQRLAIQLLEGAILVPEDEKQYSGALIKLAGVANEEFCSEFDQRMSATLKRYQNASTGLWPGKMSQKTAYCFRRMETLIFFWKIRPVWF